jgi:drug/metabolite transporter (DMT)-like permease
MQLSRRERLLGALAAIYILWGSTYLAVALGLRSMPPFLLMGTRSAVGGVILLALSGFWRTRPPPAGEWLRAALAGLLLFAGCHGSLAYAQQRVPSGVAAVFLATIPFWIMLIEALAPRGRRPSPTSVAGLLPGFTGVALIVWWDASRTDHPVNPLMILLLLGSALSWAAGSLVSRSHAPTTPPTVVAGMQLVFGGAVLLAGSAFVGEFRGFSPTGISAVSLAGLAYLTLAGTVVAFAAYVWLLDHVAGSLVATYTFVNPVIAVLLGWALLGEHLNIGMIVGTVLVIGSVVAVWRTATPAGAKAGRQTIGVTTRDGQACRF